MKSDLSKAMVSFVERKLHDGTPQASHLRNVALLDRLFVLSAGTREGESSEGQVICAKLMFLTDAMDFSMKAKTYYALGCFHDRIGSLKKAKGFFETARNLLHDIDSNTSSVSDIAEATSRRVHGKDHNCTKSVLTALQGLRLEDRSSNIDSEFGDVERWFQSI